MDRFNGGPFSASVGMAGDRQQRGRDSLFLMAALRVAGETLEDIRVRNLSEGGLMAELERPVEPGTAIEVNVRGLGWLHGRVAWYAEGRAGIAFEAPIDPKRARKPVGAKAPIRRFGKPAVTRR